MVPGCFSGFFLLLIGRPCVSPCIVISVVKPSWGIVALRFPDCTGYASVVFVQKIAEPVIQQPLRGEKGQGCRYNVALTVRLYGLPAVAFVQAKVAPSMRQDAEWCGV